LLPVRTVLVIFFSSYDFYLRVFISFGFLILFFIG
jgi:hypothetical protein